MSTSDDTMKCGCAGQRGGGVEFCALHAAATVMLELRREEYDDMVPDRGRADRERRATALLARINRATALRILADVDAERAAAWTPETRIKLPRVRPDAEPR